MNAAAQEITDFKASACLGRNSQAGIHTPGAAANSTASIRALR